MNRQEAKELLPIIQAFAEGKTIQFLCSGEGENSYWEDIEPNESIGFSDDTSKYRIKPEPKYRPFKDKEECWKEMQKHQPFGWIKDGKLLFSIITIIEEGIIIYNSVDNS